MTTGINASGLENTIKNIIEDIEELNRIFNELELEVINIQNNLSGEGSSTIIKKCNDIEAQSLNIKQNITTYITDIENIISAYQNQDQELSQIITNNIAKLEERSVINASNK